MSKKKNRKRRKNYDTDSNIGMAVPTLERPKMVDGIEIYKVESALETLTRAREIQKDKRLMKAAGKLLKNKQAAMNEVAASISDRAEIREERKRIKQKGVG